jgi:hypothetical protein
MRKTICRLAMAASCAAALSAVSLTPAQAANPVVATVGVTNVAGTVATLTGLIYTDGQPTYYEFVYGPTTSYGKQTAVRSIAAGLTSLQGVSEVITGLTPGTTYHFELVAAPAAGAYYGTPLLGGDKTFIAAPAGGSGSLRLASTKLIVKHGVVKMSFTCASSHACKGTVKVNHGSVRCARGTHFSIKAGGRKTVKASISGTCRTLLSRASRHRIRGKLVASLSTPQPKLSSGVTLIRR